MRFNKVIFNDQLGGSSIDNIVAVSDDYVQFYINATYEIIGDELEVDEEYLIKVANDLINNSDKYNKSFKQKLLLKKKLYIIQIEDNYEVITGYENFIEIGDIELTVLEFLVKNILE